jgi:hypothetical protein
MIRTSSKRPRGHISGGVFHHPQPRVSEFADGELSEEQLAALRHDRHLVVEEIGGAPTGRQAAPAADVGAETDAATAASLKQREEALDAREQALDVREQELNARAEAIKQSLAPPRNNGAGAAGAASNEATDVPAREKLLKDAIRKVVEGKQKADFTRDGRPTTEAIEREGGVDISAAERDAWFKELYPDA